MRATRPQVLLQGMVSQLTIHKSLIFCTKTEYQDIGNEILTMTKLFAGIVLNSSNTNITITLPTGASVYSSLLAIDQSIDWSVISSSLVTSGVSVGTIGSTDHGLFGNTWISPGTSARFRTRVSGVNIATTYRMS